MVKKSRPDLGTVLKGFAGLQVLRPPVSLAPHDPLSTCLLKGYFSDQRAQLEGIHQESKMPLAFVTREWADTSSYVSLQVSGVLYEMHPPLYFASNY
jgi:hypothetical protein